jgi:isopenicillin N synthase-like dioxygenase
MYIETIDYNSKMAADLFSHSLSETGFAILKNHPVSHRLIRDVYLNWAEFFASQSKLEHTRVSRSHDGYFPINSDNELKEYYHFYSWGQHPAVINIYTSELYSQLLFLGKILLSWLEKHIANNLKTSQIAPLPSLAESADNIQSLLRIIHYPSTRYSGNQELVRAASHEDIDLLTLLPAATENGLQVRDTAGSWHDIICEPNSIVINAGDILQIYTHNYCKSTTHRVVVTPNEANKSRYSLALFVHAKSEIKLPTGEVVGDYLARRLKR